MFLEFPAAGTKTAAVLPGAKGTFAAGHFAATLQQSGHAGHAVHGILPRQGLSVGALGRT